jgi:hypothetical protein
MHGPAGVEGVVELDVDRLLSFAAGATAASPSLLAGTSMADGASQANAGRRRRRP